MPPKPHLFTAAAFLVLLLSVESPSQGPGTPSQGVRSTPAAGQVSGITAASSPLDLARAALAAQGGDKFRSLKSMVLTGSVELYAPESTQSLPGSFAMVNAGEKFRLDIRSAVFKFTQIYDGQQNYSSIREVELPSPNKYGMAVLSKFDQPGYVVTALPNEKKRRAFRISDAEGNATDFYVDPTTGRVLSYIMTYRGYKFGTEYKSQKEMDGVLVPYSFVQRLELPQGAFFAEFKVKDARINQAVGDDVFVP